MDRYVQDVELAACKDINVVQVKQSYSSEVAADSIVLIPELYDQCEAKEELNISLNKRLRKYNVPYTASQLCSIAICIICSYGYTISHKTIRGVSHRDIRGIWGHIETLRVSSSPLLSEWINRCIGNRSQEGYNLQHNLPKHSGLSNSDIPRMIRRIRRRTVVSIDPCKIEDIFGGITTVRDAMINDMKLFSALRFVNGMSVPTFRPEDNNDGMSQISEF